MMDSIGLRLRAEREERGLTQQKFAELGGVKKLTQIQYEADKTAPDANYLAAVAAHGVDVTYILTGEKVSQWERHVIANTAQAVSVVTPTMESSAAENLHQSFAKMVVEPGHKKTARRPMFKELEMVCVSCSDEDFAFVMETALALARRLAKKT